MTEASRHEVCAACGTPIPVQAPGAQCPACLLRLGTELGFAAAVDATLLDAEQVRKFGDYELLEEIARGGMGVVYRAWHFPGEREVAVKMIMAGQLATRESVARFRNEAAVAARLDHPNIVPVYEVGEFETQHYFSMRYVPGKRNIATWARELPAEGRCEAIAATMAEVVRAIAFAHERGVLHRDLKPSNILMDAANWPQITDFGLAKLLDGEAATLTLSSAVLGSPSYMAPEQAEPRGREITTATDVYGLGAVLYELLAGRPPFEGSSPLQVVRRVVEESAPRLAKVPADLATLCRKCLAKEPGQRYASALALAEDLERFARGEQVEARALSTFGEIRAWARRQPVIAALLGALLLVLLLGFAGVLWQWRHAEAARLAEAEANVQLRDTINHLDWRNIEVLLERDYAPQALANLARRIRSEPQSWQAASYAISILEQRQFAFPAGPPIVGPDEEFTGWPAFAPDGRRAAYGTKDGRVHVIDSNSGQEALPPLATGGTVVAVSFSPDGTQLAAGCEDGTLLLWAMPGGRLLSRTATPAVPLRQILFTADGRSLILAGGEVVVRGAVEEFIRGQAPSAVLSAGFPVNSISSSADGRRLLGWNGKKGYPLRVWGLAEKEAQPFSPPETMDVRDASLDASGRRAAVVVGTFEVQVWDLERTVLLCRISGSTGEIQSALLTPDGTRVVVVSHIGQARVFSAETGLPASQPMSQLYQLRGVMLDQAGAKLLTGGWDRKARLWDVSKGEPLSEAIRHPTAVEHVALDAAGDRAFTVAISPPPSRRRYLQAWQLRHPFIPTDLTPPGGRELDATRLSPDDRYFAVGSWTPRTAVTVYDRSTGQPVLDRAPIKGQAYACEFSPDGRRFLAVTNTGWLHGWSTGDWQPLFAPVKMPSGLQPATLSPDGLVVGAGGTDGVLRFYDARTGAFLREMKHGALIKSVRFSPDGTRVVTAGADALAQVWEVATGRPLVTLRGHTAQILCTQFSPDGKRIVTASYDSTARLWNAETGVPLCPPILHQGNVSHAIFSPDGRRLGTGAGDGSARIWDAFTGEPLIDWILRPDTVQTVQFHPDGLRFLTNDQGGFRLWDVATGEPVTMQFREPMTGGLGVDAPSFRDCFSHDGRYLAFGLSRNRATLWPIPRPPAPVPVWFAEFIDLIASGDVDPGPSGETLPGTRLLAFRERARHFGDTDFYEAWVRRYLGL